jgi:hypothetical protein
MNTDDIKKLQKLNIEKRDLDSRLKENSREYAQLETIVLDQFAEEGVDSIKVDGKLVKMGMLLWASPKNKDDRSEACEFLKENGLEAFVSETFNTTSISAHCRAIRDNDDEELPEGFEDVFKLTEKYKITCYK